MSKAATGASRRSRNAPVHRGELQAVIVIATLLAAARSPVPPLNREPSMPIDGAIRWTGPTLVQDPLPVLSQPTRR